MPQAEAASAPIKNGNIRANVLKYIAFKSRSALYKCVMNIYEHIAIADDKAMTRILKYLRDLALNFLERAFESRTSKKHTAPQAI